MKLLLILLGIFAVVYGCVVASGLEYGSVERTIILAASTCSTAFGLVMAWTVYPVYQLLKRQRLLKSNANDKSLPISFKKFLSYKEGFESFAEQLIREFSIENLLFILEMVQIKEQILAKALLDETQIGFMINFDKKVMHVRREKGVIRNMDECMTNIGWIVDHYIDSYADYSINISSGIRNKILNATELIRDQSKVAKAKELNEIKKQRFGNVRVHFRINRNRALSAANVNTTLKAPKMKDLQKVRTISVGMEHEESNMNHNGNTGAPFRSSGHKNYQNSTEMMAMDMKDDELEKDSDIQQAQKYMRANTISTAVTTDKTITSPESPPFTPSIPNKILTDGNIDLGIDTGGDTDEKAPADTVPATPITPYTPNAMGSASVIKFDEKRASSLGDMLKGKSYEEVPEKSVNMTEEQNVLCEYIEMIDAAMKEIYQLMRKDSYIRFVGTERYTKFLTDVIGHDNKSMSTSFVR